MIYRRTDGARLGGLHQNPELIHDVCMVCMRGLASCMRAPLTVGPVAVQAAEQRLVRRQELIVHKARVLVRLPEAGFPARARQGCDAGDHALRVQQGGVPQPPASVRQGCIATGHACESTTGQQTSA